MFFHGIRTSCHKIPENYRKLLRKTTRELVAHRGMLSGLQVAISNEEQAREAALTEASRLQGLLEARLETLESGLKDTAVGLKAEISNLEESFSKFCAEEQVGHVTFLLGCEDWLNKWG